jgi:hypothetical protein
MYVLGKVVLAELPEDITWKSQYITDIYEIIVDIVFLSIHKP